MVVADHVFHDAAEEGLASLEGTFATCPITQGSLMRLLIRHGTTSVQARQILVGVTSHERHEFWPDSIGYDSVALTGVVGHRQVIDAYLAALARSHGGRLATFDRGLQALQPDVATLIAT